MTRTVPAHYLRPNHAVWTPPSLICLDTETRWHHEGDDEIHELRLWCGRFTDRRQPRGRQAEDSRAEGFGQADLALQVHKWCQRRRTVWLYCHNLTFDLLTSDLLAQLAELGWTVTDFAVDSGAPFARLSRGDCCLTMSDSFSWLPVRLLDVGAALGIAKPDLPDNDDSDEAWLARCRGDVEILSEAMLALMAWWDDCELGHWNVTGAASGWNAMRHIPTPDRILIRPDQAECAFDRLAIYGGRRFCWRTGELPRGRYAELDIERAYTTACRELPLPAGRMAKFASLPLTHRWLDCDRKGIIASVLIRTDVPRYPCRYENRVWYPVGTFRTVLAGPEIRDALDRGELLEVGAGWVHDLGYALRPWAQWVIEASRPEATGTPEVAKIVMRSWCRSAVGKWAQRGWERIRLGPSPERGWGHLDGWDHAAGVRASIVDFGGTRWQVSATGTADNAYPAILAFVESYVRIALGKAIGSIGEGCLVSCNTDGLTADVNAMLRSRRELIRSGVAHPGAADATEAIVNAASSAIAPFTLRVKSTYRQVTVLGPQHVIMDQVKRLSGVPGSAELQPDGRYHAWLWPKLAWQIRHGQPGRYVRPSAHYKLAATYAPGWVLADGAVRPVETAIGTDGTNHMRPWSLTRWARAGDRLGPVQGKGMIRYAQDEAGTDRGEGDGPRSARRPEQAAGTAKAAQETVHSLRAS